VVRQNDRTLWVLGAELADARTDQCDLFKWELYDLNAEFIPSAKRICGEKVPDKVKTDGRRCS